MQRARPGGRHGAAHDRRHDRRRHRHARRTRGHRRVRHRRARRRAPRGARELGRVGRPDDPRPDPDHGRVRGREVDPRRRGHAGAPGDPQRDAARVQTDSFPGFYVAESGFPVPWRVDSPEEVADVAHARAELGLGAIVVANPIDEPLDQELHDRVLESGLAAAAEQGIRGKDVTPSLLDHFHARPRARAWRRTCASCCATRRWPRRSPAPRHDARRPRRPDGRRGRARRRADRARKRHARADRRAGRRLGGQHGRVGGMARDTGGARVPRRRRRPGPGRSGRAARRRRPRHGRSRAPDRHVHRARRARRRADDAARPGRQRRPAGRDPARRPPARRGLRAAARRPAGQCAGGDRPRAGGRDGRVGRPVVVGAAAPGRDPGRRPAAAERAGGRAPQRRHGRQARPARRPLGRHSRAGRAGRRCRHDRGRRRVRGRLPQRAPGRRRAARCAAGRLSPRGARGGAGRSPALVRCELTRESTPRDFRAVHRNGELGMPEAVIVDAIRTPIGRAAKGSLKDVRADDLAAVPLKALVERNPDVDFSETVDLMMGCGFQMGEAGYNVGRNAALLAGLDHHIPATTVNRFCASSLQTIRMAFHAIKAGEGDQYIAAGVEAVSRFPAHAPFDPHPQLDGSEGAPYNVYIPMGLTPENVAQRCKVSREAQDEWAKTSQDRAAAARDSGHFDAEIVAVGEVSRDDGPRPGTTMEKLAELKPASTRRTARSPPATRVP